MRVARLDSFFEEEEEKKKAELATGGCNRLHAKY